MPSLSSNAQFDQYGFDMHTRDLERLWLMLDEKSGIATTPGVIGADGLAGADGAAGTAATIAVGTTTTGAPGSSASVVNSGTDSAAVFDFTVPQGPTGATGPAGPGFTNGTALGDTKVWNTSGSTWDNATAGSALSVFGRSANTNGLPSAIVAATSGHVLRYNGTAIAWGSINLAGTNDVTGTLQGAKGGTGYSTNASGDLLYGSGTAGDWNKLPIGSTGQILSVSGGLPSWQTPQLPSTIAQHAMLIGGTSSTVVAVANTTDTQAVWTGATGVAPRWATVTYTTSTTPPTGGSRGDTYYIY